MTGLRRGITNGVWLILTLAKMNKSALLVLNLVFLILVASSQALAAQAGTGGLVGNQATPCIFIFDIFESCGEQHQLDSLLDRCFCCRLGSRARFAGSGDF